MRSANEVAHRYVKVNATAETFIVIVLLVRKSPLKNEYYTVNEYFTCLHLTMYIIVTVRDSYAGIHRQCDGIDLVEYVKEWVYFIYLLLIHRKGNKNFVLL
jgi:hypothetical protein